ncbi:hypothetical protein GCM10007301_49120 [Azorhizobium oxalatiphilum]|uniref:Uncharacterized protein n=1 Tax=Azorhizobium oxalatiphilum TaxID=980631 RepID=A0A917CBR6_9HYPH|nr:hypothetical protein [Azorhizobium oxalatiphilum]GGF83209.1 hypothetical protein GCM10007301_49120 [Azorhizobium oxalatiphilum]
MAVVALIVLFLALASAVASWGVAVTEGLKAKGAADAAGGPHGSASAVQLVLWPFAARLLAGPAADHARRVGKAQVAFIAALMIAAAAISVYSNLTAVRPPLAHPAGQGSAAPSKS